MKRYQKLGAAGATFLAVWAAALQSGLVSRHPALLWVRIPAACAISSTTAWLAHSRRDRHTVACPQAPVLGVLALGAYMAALLAWGVMTFRSRPQEAAALHKVAADRAGPTQGHNMDAVVHATGLFLGGADKTRQPASASDRLVAPCVLSRTRPCVDPSPHTGPTRRRTLLERVTL